MEFDLISSDKCFDLLACIANTPGRIGKMQLMIGDLRPILWWAYNPDITFGMKKIYTTGVGNNEFNQHTFRLLSVLAKRNLTGNDAETTTVMHVRTLTYKSGELLRMIIEKDLKCGIAAGIVRERFPELLPLYEYMKPMDYNPDKVVFPSYVATKKNGIRAFYENGKFTTRKGKPIFGMDHIIQELKQNGIIHKLDGELVVPCVSFEIGTGMIRRREPTPGAFFWVWDIPHLRLRYYKRRHKVQSMLSLTSTAQWLPDYEVHSFKEIDEFYDGALSRGEEGIVVKTQQHMYKNGDSWDWMKRKETFSLDLEVVDVYEGAGKFRGCLGGIIVRYIDNAIANGVTRRIRVGSGFTDAQRRLWFAEPDRILGGTAEILFKEKTPSGKLRDPRYIRLRWDK